MAGRRSATHEVVGVVRDLVRDGAGVVATDDGVVFVPGALPNERVRFSVVGKRRGVSRGRLLEVLEASPERVDPPCGLSARCGGCPLMILRPESQRAHKAEAASRAVGRPTPVVAVAAPLGYRRRARLAFAIGRGRRLLGYRKSHGSDVVDVDACPVLIPALDEALGRLRVALMPALTGRGEVQLAMGEEGAVAWLRAEAGQLPAVYDALAAMVSQGLLAGAVLRIGETAPASWGDPRECTPGHDGKPAWGSPFGFSQANEAVNAALVAQVVAWAAPAGRRVVELYSGHGNLSVALAPESQSFFCVEASEEAAGHCRDNLRERGLDGRVVAMDAAEGVKRHRGRADVVVLDPPRTGARDAIAAIVALAPSDIVYVSCDPPTLARDLEALRDAGYAVAESAAFDMFPHTTHLEVVAHLIRDLGPKNS